MLQTIVLSILAGLAGLWIATTFVAGVDFTGSWKTFLIAGVLLGIIIAVLRPLLNLFSLVLKIIVLLGVLLGLLWILDVLFPELEILSLTSLFWTALVLLGAILIFSFFGRGKV